MHVYHQVLGAHICIRSYQVSVTSLDAGKRREPLELVSKYDGSPSQGARTPLGNSSTNGTRTSFIFDARVVRTYVSQYNEQSQMWSLIANVMFSSASLRDGQYNGHIDQWRASLIAKYRFPFARMWAYSTKKKGKWRILSPTGSTLRFRSSVERTGTFFRTKFS